MKNIDITLVISITRTKNQDNLISILKKKLINSYTRLIILSGVALSTIVRPTTSKLPSAY